MLRLEKSDTLGKIFRSALSQIQPHFRGVLVFPFGLSDIKRQIPAVTEKSAVQPESSHTITLRVARGDKTAGTLKPLSVLVFQI